MHERPDHRPQRVRRWVNRVLLAVVIVLVGVSAVAVLSGAYQVRPVLSGSMRPGLPVGGIVITERVPVSSLRVRDVVVFHRPDLPGELVVHRIIELTPGASGPVVRTQGDANDVPDPWTVTLQGSTAYRAVLTLPLVGYAAVWAHGPAGRQTLILIGLLLIVGAAASGLARRRHAASRSGRRASRREVESGEPPAVVPEDDLERSTVLTAQP